jgi:hypothetical protein
MTEELYQRRQGVPQLRDSLVAYLDVLGITQAYLQDAQATAAILDDALDRIARHFASLRPAVGGGFTGSAMHDSITLGMPLDQPGVPIVAGHALEAVQLLQASLTLVHNGHVRGLFTRGAFAAGSHFVDERFVGGQALANAVAAEGDRSNDNPWRHRPVVQILAGALTRLPPNAPGPMGAVAWCQDRPFVNYLGGFTATPATPGSFVATSEPDVTHALGQHAQIVGDNLRAACHHGSTAAKYRWLAGYHNAFCQQLGLTELRVVGTDPDPNIAFSPASN